MQQRFFAGSRGQTDVDKCAGVIYVKSGYCKGEKANRRGGGARAASGPARWGQGGGQCGHPGGTVIAPGLTRRQGLRAPPSISIQLVKLSLDRAGGQA